MTGSVMRKSALLLVNGSAGTAQMGNRAWHLIEMLVRAGYRVSTWPILPSEDLGSEEILTQEEREGRIYDLVVCCGGDGTLMHVVNGVMRLLKKPVLGYIPAGSTNDFARSANIPTQYEEALRTVINGKKFRYDIGRFNDRYFNYVAAFGAFVAVTYTTDQNFKNIFGHAAYVLNGISTLGQSISYKCHMRVAADGFEAEDDYVFGLVYNSTSVGGIKLRDSADVRLDDGKFGLLLIKAPENLAEAGQIIQGFLDDAQNNPDGMRDNSYVVSLRNISRVEISAPAGAAWTLDGEYGGEPTDIVIEVVPGAMEIMVPK